jgi:hypothetical protein
MSITPPYDPDASAVWDFPRASSNAPPNRHPPNGPTSMGAALDADAKAIIPTPKVTNTFKKNGLKSEPPF